MEYEVEEMGGKDPTEEILSDFEVLQLLTPAQGLQIEFVAFGSPRSD